MIQSKSDLKRYLLNDMSFYKEHSLKSKIIDMIIQDPIYLINKYIYFLRMEEYYSNVKKYNILRFFSLYYLRKKNKIGNKLGFKIPRNCFGPGLTIFHHGEIIINENVRVGKNCKLHGGNCIGNNGFYDSVISIGDNLDMGIGAKIIGDVSLGHNVIIGANAVVTKSFVDGDVTLVGVPARKLNRG